MKLPSQWNISILPTTDEKRHGLLLEISNELRHSTVSLQGILYHLGMTKRRASSVDPHLAKEAKSIVAQCFRNGPIEDLHAGIKCPTCSGDEKYSHITQREMKRIMKDAVDKVYTLLWLKERDPDKYQALIEFGAHYTSQWNEPKLDSRF